MKCLWDIIKEDKICIAHFNICLSEYLCPVISISYKVPLQVKSYLFPVGI